MPHKSTHAVCVKATSSLHASKRESTAGTQDWLRCPRVHASLLLCVAATHSGGVGSYCVHSLRVFTRRTAFHHLRPAHRRGGFTSFRGHSQRHSFSFSRLLKRSRCAERSMRGLQSDGAVRTLVAVLLLFSSGRMVSASTATLAAVGRTEAIARIRCDIYFDTIPCAAVFVYMHGLVSFSRCPPVYARRHSR